MTHNQSVVTETFFKLTEVPISVALKMADKLPTHDGSRSVASRKRQGNNVSLANGKLMCND